VGSDPFRQPGAFNLFEAACRETLEPDLGQECEAILTVLAVCSELRLMRTKGVKPGLQTPTRPEGKEAMRNTKIYIDDFRVPIPVPLDARGATQKPFVASRTLPRFGVVLVGGKLRDHRRRA
jgi:hypothetical protein